MENKKGPFLISTSAPTLYCCLLLQCLGIMPSFLKSYCTCLPPLSKLSTWDLLRELLDCIFFICTFKLISQALRTNRFNKMICHLLFQRQSLSCRNPSYFSCSSSALKMSNTNSFQICKPLEISFLPGCSRRQQATWSSFHTVFFFYQVFHLDFAN